VANSPIRPQPTCKKDKNERCHDREQMELKKVGE